MKKKFASIAKVFAVIAVLSVTVCGFASAEPAKKAEPSAAAEKSTAENGTAKDNATVKGFPVCPNPDCPFNKMAERFKASAAGTCPGFRSAPYAGGKFSGRPYASPRRYGHVPRYGHTDPRTARPYAYGYMPHRNYGRAYGYGYGEPHTARPHAYGHVPRHHNMPRPGFAPDGKTKAEAAPATTEGNAKSESK